MEQMILEVAKRARIRYVCGDYAPVVNCTAFEEEVCTQILKLFPNVAFAACWHQRKDGSELWTLYSAGDYDVSQIALRMHGNGNSRRAELIDPAIDVERVCEERDQLLETLAARRDAIVP